MIYCEVNSCTRDIYFKKSWIIFNESKKEITNFKGSVYVFKKTPESKKMSSNILKLKTQIKFLELAFCFLVTF